MYFLHEISGQTVRNVYNSNRKLILYINVVPAMLAWKFSRKMLLFLGEEGKGYDDSGTADIC